MSVVARLVEERDVLIAQLAKLEQERVNIQGDKATQLGQIEMRISEGRRRLARLQAQIREHEDGGSV